MYSNLFHNEVDSKQAEKVRRQINQTSDLRLRFERAARYYEGLVERAEYAGNQALAKKFSEKAQWYWEQENKAAWGLK